MPPTPQPGQSAPVSTIKLPPGATQGNLRLALVAALGPTVNQLALPDGLNRFFAQMQLPGYAWTDQNHILTVTTSNRALLDQLLSATKTGHF